LDLTHLVERTQRRDPMGLGLTRTNSQRRSGKAAARGRCRAIHRLSASGELPAKRAHHPRRVRSESSKHDDLRAVAVRAYERLDVC
jgi:hypothetical protein